jgi:hypothetical protein
MTIDEQQTKKSPIKEQPMRVPGQSLSEEMDKVLNDQLMLYFMVPTLMVMMAVTEWVKWHNNAKPNPVMWTIIAAISIVWFVIKYRQIKQSFRNLKLGHIGELAVGQFLEETLRPMGCQVLHDIPFDGFNIDHVVIGENGIYAIETKTHRKPARGQASVNYDGQQVTVNGCSPDRDPVVQAKANAHSLRDLLEQSTSKRFAIRPVLLYPGWFVDRMPPNPEIWVLNEKALVTFIGKSQQTLSPEDVSLITFHLKRYVLARGQEKK